ncbi:MAG: F0F1 ATP synthase subunit delta [Nitrospirota bacterium]
MKFDIWTFLFQVVNFIVLLFVLRRILYKPIREIMEKRRGMIEKNIREAEAIRKAADDLREKYEQEMSGLTEERKRMLEKIQEELSEEKKRLIDKAEKEASGIIEKEKALFEADKRRAESALKERAVDTVCLLASNIFRDLSDPEFHKAIFRKLEGQIEKVAPNVVEDKIGDEALSVDVSSAYKLTEEEMRKIRETVEAATRRRVSIKATVDAGLIAGAKIRMLDMAYDFSISGQIESLRAKLKEA